MSLVGTVDGGIVLAVQSGGAGSFGAQSANLVFAGPATGPAATPTFRALTMADIPAKARTLMVQCHIPGPLPGLTATYAGPGTTPSGGLGSATSLMTFWVPGIGPSSSWLLQGVLGQLGTAPGGMNTLTVTVQKSTGGGPFSNTANTFTINAANTEGYNDTNAVSFASNDKVAVKVDGGGAAADLSLTLVFLRQS